MGLKPNEDLSSTIFNIYNAFTHRYYWVNPLDCVFSMLFIFQIPSSLFHYEYQLLHTK